jgi:AcrR family transcriptional regulator
MPKSRKPQTRDPDATRARILAAARTDFARRGLAGARVDMIAARAKSNKRMMYHYFGNKEELFRITLEQAYADIREAEAALEIDKDDPLTAIRRLVAFTWNYYLAHPHFITLVNSENLHGARHLKGSKRTREMSRDFVLRMQRLLARGAREGVFRKELDPVQVNITIAGLGYYYLTNRHTGSLVYERDLMSEKALAERLAFNTKTVLRMVCTPDTLARIDPA